MTKEERLVELLYSNGNASSTEVEYLVQKNIEEFLTSYFQGDGCEYFIADGSSEVDLINNLDSLLIDTNINLSEEQRKKLLNDMGKFSCYEDMMKCASECFAEYGYSLVWLNGSAELSFDEDGYPSDDFFEICYGDYTEDDMVYAIKIVKNDVLKELETLIAELLPNNMNITIF